MDSMQVGNTIRDQIAAGRANDGTTGWQAMMCWGADRLTGAAASDQDMGWLSFSVKGRKFKGHVKVRLMFNDTYTVEFKKRRKYELITVKSHKDVYFDELTRLIDSYVESGAK